MKGEDVTEPMFLHTELNSIGYICVRYTYLRIAITKRWQNWALKIESIGWYAFGNGGSWIVWDLRNPHAPSKLHIITSELTFLVTSLLQISIILRATLGKVPWISIIRAAKLMMLQTNWSSNSPILPGWTYRSSWWGKKDEPRGDDGK